MAGQPGAGFLIGRVGGQAAGIADRRDPDALGLPEQALGAPEAAHAEIGGLQALGIGTLQRALRNDNAWTPSGWRVRGREAPRRASAGSASCSACRSGRTSLPILLGCSIPRRSGLRERAHAALRSAADRVEQQRDQAEHDEARQFENEYCRGIPQRGMQPGLHRGLRRTPASPARRRASWCRAASSPGCRPPPCASHRAPP